MSRCLELARQGAGSVAPNPMVGAVLVHQNRIIGEGFHQQYGQAHAEVNCIQSVSPEDLELISHSTMYVSLEPCAHHGKTPPCADLIIRNRIPVVNIACRDPFPSVSGKGIEKLEAAGIKVNLGILKEDAVALNRRFFTFHLGKRPYIILKWAQTADGWIGNKNAERLLITDDVTNRLVHRWRSEEAAIMVGTETALADNPSLTNRYWTGRSPLRLVLDRQLRLPTTLSLFEGEPTVVFNEKREELAGSVRYVKVEPGEKMLSSILKKLYDMNVQSVLVEGGLQLLQSFIDQGLWDEARVITNTKLTGKGYVAAPVLINEVEVSEEKDPAMKVIHYRHERLNNHLNFTF